MNALLLGVLCYVLGQFAIAIAVSRRVRTEDDYLVAGRRLGYGLATFSIFATWFGAETCIGAAGMVYDEGLAGTYADPFGYGICIFLLGFVFAARLWRRKIVTLADLFAARFGPGVARLAALVMIPTSLLWAGAQVRAFGQILSVTSGGIPVETALAVAAALTIAYTALGGMLADAWSDLVQGLALAVGLVVILFAVVGPEGVSGIPAAVASVDPERLRLFPRDASWLDNLENYATPVLGSVVAQELVARCVSSRSASVARRSALLAASVYVLLGLIPVFIGLIGPERIPGLDHGEQILPEMARRSLPPVLYVVFAGALVSAILSTVDSALLVSSSLLSHNVIQPLRPDMSDRAKVRVARAGVIVFGLTAYALAHSAEGIHELVETASGLGSAGLLVCLVFGLFTTRFGGAWSAAAALVGAVVVYLHEAAREGPWPFLASLAAALAAYLGFAAFGRRRPHEDASASGLPP